MHALVFGKARIAAPAQAVGAGRRGWMWPGVPLTERRGAASVPIGADVARLWIRRLHGPEAIDSAVLRCLAIAAQELTAGDEAGAQWALDAGGLARLSSDGAVFMPAVRLAPHTYLCERCTSPAKCRRQAITFAANHFAGD